MITVAAVLNHELNSFQFHLVLRARVGVPQGFRPTGRQFRTLRTRRRPRARCLLLSCPSHSGGPEIRFPPIWPQFGPTLAASHYVRLFIPTSQLHPFLRLNVKHTRKIHVFNTHTVIQYMFVCVVPDTFSVFLSAVSVILSFQIIHKYIPRVSCGLYHFVYCLGSSVMISV